MMRNLWIAAFALLAQQAGAAVAFVNSTERDDAQTGTSATIVWDGNPVTTNAAVIGVFWKADVTITSVADSQTNTWADCGAGRLARPTDGYLQMFCAANITGGTTPTVTVNFSGSMNSCNLYLAEYSGAATASMVDGTATGTETVSATITSGNLTPSVASGVIVAFAVGNVEVSAAGTNFTSREVPAGAGDLLEDRIFTTSVGTTTATAVYMSGVARGGIVAAVIKAASQPAGLTVNPISGRGGAAAQPVITN